MTDKLRYAYDDEGFFVDMHQSAPEEDVLGTELLPGEVVDLLNTLDHRVVDLEFAEKEYGQALLKLNEQIEELEDYRREVEEIIDVAFQFAMKRLSQQAEQQEKI